MRDRFDPFGYHEEPAEPEASPRPERELRSTIRRAVGAAVLIALAPSESGTHGSAELPAPIPAAAKASVSPLPPLPLPAMREIRTYDRTLRFRNPDPLLLRTSPEELPTEAAGWETLLAYRVSKLRTMLEEDQLNLARYVDVVKGLERRKVREPGRLVETVLEEVSRHPEYGVDPFMVLAIITNESHGKPSLSSWTVARGLGQIMSYDALRYRKIDGGDWPVPVGVKELEGQFRYFMKRPIYDCYKLALKAAAKTEDEAGLGRIRAALAFARDVNADGNEQLELLAVEGGASEQYRARIARATAENEARIARLEELLEHPEKKVLEAFAEESRVMYKALYAEQKQLLREAMLAYDKRRDALVERKFGASAKQVFREQSWEACAYLGEEYDGLLDPRRNIAFVVRHLAAKQLLAAKLARDPADLEARTVKLNNGGEVNEYSYEVGIFDSRVKEVANYLTRYHAVRDDLVAAFQACEAPRGTTEEVAAVIRGDIAFYEDTMERLRPDHTPVAVARQSAGTVTVSEER